jgi:hypothetical protein
LQNYIFETHDWDNETPNFKSEAIALFGNNWKQEISKISSWMGLEETVGYNNFILSYQGQTAKINYIINIRSNLLNAKNDCQ